MLIKVILFNLVLNIIEKTVHSNKLKARDTSQHWAIGERLWGYSLFGVFHSLALIGLTLVVICMIQHVGRLGRLLE